VVSGTGGFISNLRGLGWPVVAERSKQKRDGLSAFDVLIIERAGAAGGAGQSWGNGAAHPTQLPHSGPAPCVHIATCASRCRGSAS